MKILVVDNGTRLLGKLEKLSSLFGTVEKTNKINSLHAEGYDLVILSGSSTSSVLYGHDEYAEEINLIRSGGVPVIGICFGCELIAYAFGGELKELTARHHGIKEIEILSGVFKEKNKKVSIYENHRWIISKVPEEFEVIAMSPEGPEGIRHKSLPLYGLQFHPENFVDETEGDELFGELIARISSVLT